MAPDHERTDHSPPPDSSFGGEITSHDTAPAPAPETVAVGTRVGPYLIIDTLGAGAMGIVYAALDPRLDRQVAIKMVRANPGEASKGAPRLLREAQALAKLAHPNVVPVFDVGQHHEGVFLAMELVRGADFRQWLGGERRDWRAVLDVLLEAGKGLAAAHAAGIVHRDFKPDNILLDDSGRARVTDFGLARGQGEADGPPSLALEGNAGLSDTLTRTGAVVGTPSYMAPEQHTGRPVDSRADQYAFCVTLYEAVYGERPFVGRDLQALANHKWTETFASDVRTHLARAVPAALDLAIRRGLKRNPDERFPDMTALLAELGRLRRLRRPWRWLLAAVGTGAMGVAALLWITRPSPCPDARGQLAGVWDAERSASIERAFIGAQTAAGPQSYVRVASALDDFASSWVDAHAQLCNAALRSARGDPELDGGMLCLRQARARLGGVLDVLEEGSRASVHAADTLLATLTDPHACHDASMRVESPHLTRERQHLREGLDVAEVRLDAAQYGTAREMASAIERDARALGVIDLELEAQLQIAIADVRSGRYAIAETGFTSVFWGAAAAGLDELALHAATRLVFLMGGLVDRPDEGFHWLRHAEALLERLREGETLARAKLLENAATVYESARDEERSEALLREALAIRLRLQPDDAAAVSTVRNNLALRLNNRGAHAEALALHELAHRNRVLRLGPFHPDVAMSLINEARVLYELRRVSEAIERLAAAEPIVRGSLGGSHPMMETIQMSRGAALLRLGHFDAARAYLQLALTMRSLSMGPDSPAVGHLWNILAVTYEQQHDVPRARLFFARAKDIFAASGSQGDLGVAYVLSNQGSMELLYGDLDDAERMIEEAVAIFERVRKPGHRDVEVALSNRVQVELAKADYDAAGKTLQTIAELQRMGTGGSGLRTVITESMATRLAWLRIGAPADAQVQLAALRELIAREDPAATEVVVIDRWLERLAQGRPLAG